MKITKRILAVLLALTLVLAFGACAKKEETPAPAGSETSEEVEAGAEAGSVLTMGTNAEFPPYEFHADEGIVGIDAEIAAAIAQKLGMELVIEDMEFDSIIPAIQSGKIDIGMAGMTVTDERLEVVNFSDSYATGVQAIIVKEDSDITSADDLFVEGANHTVGVQLATTGDLYSTWDIEDEGLGTIERYNKGADAVMALVTGKVDCVIIDNEPAKAYVAENEGLKILETAYAVEDYAIAMAKGNDELYEKVNNALNELIADGTVQAIIDKYISAE